MKNIFLIIIASMLFSFSAKSQKHWTFDMYKTVSHKNFRKNKLFQKEYDDKNPDIPLLDAAIFFATNEQRAKKRLTIMKYHKSCEIASYNHSKKMVKDDFFSHTNSKDKKRKNPSDRIILAGADTGAWGENVAYNYSSNGDTYLNVADKILFQWMHSEGHKKNILNKTNIYFGCGIYPKNNSIYATQFFIRSSTFTEIKAVDKLPPLKK